VSIVVCVVEPQNEPPDRRHRTPPSRARGDGTVYFDKDRGRWVGAITVAGRRRKVTAKTKTEATARLRELLAAKVEGRPIADRSTTVATIVADFLERGTGNRGRPLAPQTLSTLEWAGRTIVNGIGRSRAASLSVAEVERFLDRLADDGMARSSLRTVRGTLARSYDFAKRHDTVTTNPARDASLPPQARRQVQKRSLSPVEARALLAALRSERNGAMFALSLLVGLRPGEASGIYWSDLRGSTLHVTRGVQLDHGRPFVADELKTKRSKRAIGLPDDLVVWLGEHRRQQAEERLAARSWVDDRLMFASTNGAVLSPSNSRRQLAAVTRRAGVTEVTPHELRHSCASLLLDEGVAIEQVADLLGHSAAAITDEVYRHRLRPVVDVAASARWSSIVG
jgi:integrase